MSVRRFFRLLLDKNWHGPVPTVDDSLAKTAKHAGHVGGRVPGSSSTSKVYEHIGEGHENYAKSFKKKDS